MRHTVRAYFYYMATTTYSTTRRLTLDHYSGRITFFLETSIVVAKIFRGEWN